MHLYPTMIPMAEPQTAYGSTGFIRTSLRAKPLAVGQLIFLALACIATTQPASPSAQPVHLTNVPMMALF